MPLSTRPITVTRHVQLVPSLTWTINHGQGSYPLVDVYVEHDGAVQKIIPSAVTYTDENTVTLSFVTSTAGFATVVV